MERDNLDLVGVRATWRGNDYVVDFNVQFEVHTHLDIICDSNGDPIETRETEHVYFRQVTVKSVIDIKTGIGATHDGAHWMNGEIEEICLGWCDDCDSLRQEALDHYHNNP